MSLPIPVLQSLLARNRDAITSLHISVGVSKGARDYHSHCGLRESAECYHKKVVKCSKGIEKLVILPKALKQELKQAIWQASAVRTIQRMTKEWCMAQAVNAFEHT